MLEKEIEVGKKYRDGTGLLLEVKFKFTPASKTDHYLYVLHRAAEGGFIGLYDKNGVSNISKEYPEYDLTEEVKD